VGAPGESYPNASCKINQLFELFIYQIIKNFHDDLIVEINSKVFYMTSNFNERNLLKGNE